MAMKEHQAFSMSGGLAILIGLVLLGGGPAWAFSQIPHHQMNPGPYLAVAMVSAFFGILVLKGCFIVGPNEARVLTLFGKYAGTVKETGPRWANPFTTKRPVSLRARNFETAKIKVNDIEGNPIEIGAVVVWKVMDTAQAMFDVENFGSYVQIQAEAAVRNLAMHHPYDSHDENVVSLRGQSDHVAEQLRKEINERVKQAGAIIAARQRIVEGAVSMVEMALDQLAKRGIVELDPERKAAMVSNLLVVLCGERATQPVVNAGTLY
jgi:regulator of protease activity HflC (stomatin/prohibitin superfamily)